MIKSYEVTVAKSQFKTLLVNAVSEAAAVRMAEEAYAAGEYDFCDVEPEFYVLDTDRASGNIYEVNYSTTEDENSSSDGHFSLIEVLIAEENNSTDSEPDCCCNLKKMCSKRNTSGENNSS